MAVLRDRRRLPGSAVVLLVRRLDLRRLDRRDLRDGARLDRLLAGLDRRRPGRRAAAVHSGFYPSAVLYAVYGGSGRLRLRRLAAGHPRRESPRAASRARWRHEHAWHRSGSRPRRRCAQGRPVLVVDDEDRENEGDLILAARDRDPRAGWRSRSATPRGVRLRADGGRGGRPARAAADGRRQRGPAAAPRTPSRSTPATASAPASARPTAPHTIRLLADSATEPPTSSRPGHVFPLRAADGGVLQRAGHTEAAVDLCRLAGLAPVGRRSPSSSTTTAR